MYDQKLKARERRHIARFVAEGRAEGSAVVDPARALRLGITRWKARDVAAITGDTPRAVAGLYKRYVNWWDQRYGLRRG